MSDLCDCIVVSILLWFWIRRPVRRQTDAFVMKTYLRGRAKQPQCFWPIHYFKFKLVLLTEKNAPTIVTQVESSHISLKVSRHVVFDSFLTMNIMVRNESNKGVHAAFNLCFLLNLVRFHAATLPARNVCITKLPVCKKQMVVLSCHRA